MKLRPASGRRRRGAHQLARPSSAISAGTSSARTIVESMITASAAPTPNSFSEATLETDSEPTAAQNSTRRGADDAPAALETGRHRDPVGGAGCRAPP